MERFGVSGDRFSLETPDGHRAPLADLLSGARSRSVNTQTPQDFDSSHSSSGNISVIFFTYIFYLTYVPKRFLCIDFYS